MMDKGQASNFYNDLLYPRLPNKHGSIQPNTTAEFPGTSLLSLSTQFKVMLVTSHTSITTAVTTEHLLVLQL